MMSEDDFARLEAALRGALLVALKDALSEVHGKLNEQAKTLAALDGLVRGELGNTLQFTGLAVRRLERDLTKYRDQVQSSPAERRLADVCATMKGDPDAIPEFWDAVHALRAERGVQ